MTPTRLTPDAAGANRTGGGPRSPRTRPSDVKDARLILGAEHPLSRAVERATTLRRQLVIALALLAGALIDLAAGAGWALRLAAAAVTVLTALAVAVAVAELIVRDRALEVIADGRDTLPITAIRRARDRLSDPRTQRQLARAIDTTIEHTLKQPRLRTRAGQPLYQRRVISTVTEELDAIAQLLRTERASVRGVALTEQLLANGTSPFYGESPERLRNALDRIQRAILAERTTPSS